MEHTIGTNKQGLPVVKDVNLQVHKVYIKYKNGKTPQEILLDLYSLHKFRDQFNSANLDIEFETVAESLNITHIESALRYAEENKEEINKIISEQRKLQEQLIEEDIVNHRTIDENSIEY